MLRLWFIKKSDIGLKCILSTSIFNGKSVFKAFVLSASENMLTYLSQSLTKEHHTNILFRINQTTQSHASLAIHKMMRMNLLHHDVNRNHYLLYIIHYRPYHFRRLMINNLRHSVKAQLRALFHLGQDNLWSYSHHGYC